MVSMLQYNCMFDSKLINIFTFGEGYIDKAILNTLLRLETSLPVQTYITMCWNRCEVAREILSETDEIDQLKDNDRKILFRNCIFMDRVEFMDILFDYDIVNKEFLLAMTDNARYGKLLEKFYIETPQTESPFYYLWNLYFGDRPITIDRLGVFENLIFKMENYTSCYDTDQMKYHGIEPFYALRDLFIWALLLGKIEMSFVVFRHIDLGLSSALAAIRLLKRLSDYSDNETQKALMLSFAHKYEMAAKGILDRCYQYSRQDVIKVLLRRNPQWGDVKMTQLAIAAGSRLIKTHPAIQLVTSCAWQGALHSSTRWYQVLSCIFFPPIIFSRRFIKFNFSKDVELGDPESIMLVAITAELNVMRTTDIKHTQPKSTTFKSVKKHHTKVEVDKNLELNDDDSILGDANDLQELCSNSSESEFDEDDFEENIASLEEEPLSVRFGLFISSPQVIFTTHTISFAIFLFLYARMLLLDFTLRPTAHEWFLAFWVFTFVCEEIRQIFEQPVSQKPKRKKAQNDEDGFYHYLWKSVKNWASSPWNQLDLLAIITFYFGFFLRYGVKELDPCDPYVMYQDPNSNCSEPVINRTMYGAHGFSCLSFMLYGLRLLHVLTMSKNVGPKLVMVQKMMRDIFTLLSILAVFMLSYGVVSQALLYPNHNDWRFQLRRMVRRAYFHIYGELFLEEVDFIPGRTP